MNIYDSLNDKGIEFSLAYFGLNDITTNYDVKCVLQNTDFIKEYYKEKFSGKVETLDQYIDYLVLRKINRMEELMDYLKLKEDKDNMLVTFKYLKSIKTENGSIIKYINGNIKNIMKESIKYSSIVEATMELIMKYCNGISEEVFIYLAKEHYHLLFYNYDKLQKAIESKVSILSILLSDINIKNVLYNRDLKRVLEIIQSLKERKYNKYKKVIDDSIEAIIKLGEEINKNITMETALQYSDIMMDIFNFLAQLKHIKATEFERYCLKINKLEEDHVRLHGQEFQYEIPIQPIIKFLKSDTEWLWKTLYLTHSLDEKSKRIISRLDLDEERRSSILNMISTNIKTNDFFTRTHQKYLYHQLNVGTVMVLTIFGEKDLLSECCEWYDAILKYICEKIDYVDSDLYNDFGLLYQMIYNLFYTQESIEKEIESALSYGPCMFICSLVEKLLRVIYKYEKQKDEYITIDRYTLGELLSEQNDVITRVLGSVQVKHLRYFFLTDPDGKVGQDYRNRLAHWRDFAPYDLNKKFFCKLFFLFMNIVNSIFVFYFHE